MITYVAKPYDKECEWWSAEIPMDLSVEDLSRDEVIINKYLKNQDLELETGTLLIDCEQKEPYMDEYMVLLGIVTDWKVEWYEPYMKTKKYIKAKGHQDLMVGSGPIKAVLRTALYLRRHKDPVEAYRNMLEEMDEMKGKMENYQ